MTQQTLLKAPDLRQTFPRSPNETLGCFVILPRIIDKCRASIAGTQGEYKYNCPLDRRFFDFTGVDADKLKNLAAEGKSDEALLEFVNTTRKNLSEDNILAWCYQERTRRPDNPDAQAFFEALRRSGCPSNHQVETWFQLLDAEEKRI